ncbi:MAG: hypothetical protein DRJ42_11725 [Deltaproteobacteria bacterium]|nr:MAG: hypothetical protein DRJ42_11725 [Deltaproteobacteria bacterium]
MYVDLPNLTDALRATIKSGKTSPRYWAWSLGFLDFYALMASSVTAAQRLDDALYPEWRRTQVKEPVFIFAGARSGTTLLHRLLALDEERFTSFKLYQTVVPAVSAYKAVDALGALDQKFLGGRVSKKILAFDQSLFPGFRDIHPMGLTEAEEEEALFIYTLVSPAMLMLFPFIDEIPRAWSMDHLPESAKDKVMDFYRGCIQRHLTAEGVDRTMLVKSVLAAPRAEAMLDTFPDGRVIHLVRHPYQSIASAISLLTLSWRSLFPDWKPDAPEFRRFGYLMMDFYRRYSELGDHLGEDRFITVPFDELTKDPQGQVEAIYERFGWNMPQHVHDRLVRECSVKKQFKSTHKYSLEDFGLTKDEVYEELGDLFEKYGFER